MSIAFWERGHLVRNSFILSEASLPVYVRIVLTKWPNSDRMYGQTREQVICAGIFVAKIQERRPGT